MNWSWLTTKRLVAIGLAIGLFVGLGAGAATLGGEPAAPISGGVPLAAADGPTVTVHGDVNASLDDFTDGPNTVNVTTDAGNVTLSSSGQTSAAVFPGTNLTGTWTNVTEMSIGGTQLTVTPADKPKVRLLGDPDTVGIRDTVALDDGAADFYLGGPNGGLGTLTLTQGWGLPSGKRVAAVDAETGEVLDVSTTDGTGALTLDIPLSEHAVKLQTSDGGPTLTNGQPTGLVSDPPQQVSVDVSDPDFPGDDVAVNVSIDNTHVGTVNRTSGGTATVSINPDNYDGGRHNVSVVATDAYGQTATENYTFSVPDTLFVYNESDPDQLVTNANVSVRFYYRNGTELEYVTRNTTDGKVNLTGLPVSQPLTASVRVDGYYNRRVFLQSLYQQQKVYVLPESKKTATVKFGIRDFTGAYPDDSTVLIVQRGLGGDFETVQADFLGATGELPTTLRFNRRHTLTLLNTETGETRNLGTYTPLSSGSQTVTVAVSGLVNVTGVENIADVEPSARRLPAQEVTLRIRLQNQSADISEYQVRGVVEHNGSTTEVFNVTRTAAGTLTQNVTLDNASGGLLRIETEYVTGDGGVSGVQEVVYDIASRSNDRTGGSLLDALANLVALVPPGNQAGFTTMAGIVASLIGTLALASRYRLPTELSGAVGAMWLTGFAIIGWVTYTLVFIASVLVAALVVIRQVV